MRTTLIGAACLMVAVAATGCSKDRTTTPSDQTNTTSGAAPIDPGAAAGDTSGVAPREPGNEPMQAPTVPNSVRDNSMNGSGVNDNNPANPYPNGRGTAYDNSGTNGARTAPAPDRDRDRSGSSFESSGGSSGLGTVGHREVPGQRLFDTKPTSMRDGG